MNANELAILLDKLNEEEYRSGVIEETITMLRQQQAEIDEWKYIIERLNSVLKKKEAEIEALKEQLDKAIDAEKDRRFE
jgi:hypothetical protein